MSVSIGEVNISLRMSLAQFKQDVKQGASAASQGARQLGDEFRGASNEATGSLALIGEELGVKIPRHLRKFITAVPGVGTALNAAFSSVAVLALIGVIVEIISKVQEFRQHAEEVAKAWDALGDSGREALRKLDIQILETEKRLAELRQDHVLALQLSLKAIDAQKLDNIGAQFKILAKQTDEAFATSKKNWFIDWLTTGSVGNGKIIEVQKAFDSLYTSVKRLDEAGKTDQIGPLLDQEMARARAIEAGLNIHLHGSAEYKAALDNELASLEALRAVYTEINTVSTNQKDIAIQEDRNRVIAEQKKKLDEVTAAVEKFNESLQRVGTFHNVISQSLGVGNIDPTGIFKAGAALEKGPKDNPAKPVFGGTKEAQDLYKITMDENAAIAEAQKIYTGTRTAAEQYQDTVNTLNVLLSRGALDQETYNRALQQAYEKYQGSNKDLQEFGKNVGETLKQAALFGRGWSDAFKSIAIELAQLILKLTLFKSLQATSAAGGGGFWGFLISGIAGKFASGGTALPDKSYLVGENGPEVVSFNRSAQISPIRGGGAAGSPQNVSVAMHIHGVTDADSFRKSESQLAREMGAQILRHTRRNG